MNRVLITVCKCSENAQRRIKYSRGGGWGWDMVKKTNIFFFCLALKLVVTIKYSTGEEDKRIKNRSVCSHYVYMYMCTYVCVIVCFTMFSVV